MSELGHVHQFVPSERADARVLLMLHGTGGDEHDLIQLGQMLDPAAALLSPRGNVLEHGAPRFFRRLAEGVFDLEDLRRRTHELADFVEGAVKQYGLEGRRIVAVGFSNGANIAASLLLLRPRVLHGAVLFRAMVPFEPEKVPFLGGLPILLSEGRFDPLVGRKVAERLATIFKTAGAEVTLIEQESGHELTRADVDDATKWLASHPASRAAAEPQS
ncbi:MAG TPA: alpha/beta hydrolase [Candidatus Eisenbacteria bacterium]|nr:alpha/beta hydrolase [Candidatus Eisenbacteria bacterium]